MPGIPKLKGSHVIYDGYECLSGSQWSMLDGILINQFPELEKFEHFFFHCAAPNISHWAKPVFFPPILKAVEEERAMLGTDPVHVVVESLWRSVNEDVGGELVIVVVGKRGREKLNQIKLGALDDRFLLGHCGAQHIVLHHVVRINN